MLRYIEARDWCPTRSEKPWAGSTPGRYRTSILTLYVVTPPVLLLGRPPRSGQPEVSCTMNPMSEQRVAPADTVDFLYDTMKGSADQTMAQVKSLEGRAAQAFSGGTVLLGLGSFGGLQAAHISGASIAFLVIAAAAYLGAALCGIATMRPATIHGLPSLAGMWALRGYPCGDLKQSLMQTLVEAESLNDSAIKGRRRWALAAVTSVGVEGAAFGLALAFAHAS